MTFVNPVGFDISVTCWLQLKLNSRWDDRTGKTAIAHWYEDEALVSAVSNSLLAIAPCYVALAHAWCITCSSGGRFEWHA